jgi:hypothetical protein
VLVVPPPPQPVKKKVPHENSPSQSQAERLKIYSGLPETPDYMKLDSVVPQDPMESSLLMEPRRIGRPPWIWEKGRRCCLAVTQCEIYGDRRVNLYRSAVQDIWLELPLFDCVNGSWGQKRMPGYESQALDVSGFPDDRLQYYLPWILAVLASSG